MGKDHIIWLSYFDCTLKRRYGRRVPLSLCLDNPKPKELLHVCAKLGIECEYLEKKYPRVWYRSVGYIIVKNVSTRKSELVKALAKEVKSIRLSSKDNT